LPVGGWLLTVGCWLLVVGCWLAVGCCRLAVGGWRLAVGGWRLAVVSVECGVLATLTVGDDISQVLIKFLNPLSTPILEISDSKVYLPTKGREAWVGWRGGASEADFFQTAARGFYRFFKPQPLNHSTVF